MTVAEIMEAVKELKVMELSELVKALEECRHDNARHGVAHQQHKAIRIRPPKTGRQAYPAPRWRRQDTRSLGLV